MGRHPEPMDEEMIGFHQEDTMSWLFIADNDAVWWFGCLKICHQYDAYKPAHTAFTTGY